MTGPATLEEIRSDSCGALYPRDLLEGCTDALVLFAAGFHGRQDAFWVAEAGMTATCVDNDPQLLFEMSHVYPIGWEFVTDDVFEYAEHTDRQWDIVSLDCPTGAFERCAEHLDDWCRHARRVVILGTGPRTSLSPPGGWELTGRRYRTSYEGGVYWAILEPS